MNVPQIRSISLGCTDLKKLAVGSSDDLPATLSLARRVCRRIILHHFRLESDENKKKIILKIQ